MQLGPLDSSNTPRCVPPCRFHSKCQLGGCQFVGAAFGDLLLHSLPSSCMQRCIQSASVTHNKNHCFTQLQYKKCLNCIKDHAVMWPCSFNVCLIKLPSPLCVCWIPKTITTESWVRTGRLLRPCGNYWTLIVQLNVD